MNFARLALNLKIAIGFGSLLLISAVLGGVGYRASVNNQSLSRKVLTNTQKKDLTRAVQLSLEHQRVGIRDLLMDRDPWQFLAGRKEYAESMTKLKPLLNSETSKQRYALIEAAYATYSARYDKVISLHQAGQRKQALDLFTEHAALLTYKDLEHKTNDLAGWYEDHTREADDNQTQADAQTRRLMMILVPTALVLGALIAVVIARSIIDAMRQMSSVIQSIAASDLTHEDMQVVCDDVVGKAALGLNQMKNGLREIILSIAATAQDVSSSSRAIAATASQTAEGAYGQRQQVEQVTLAMREMAATVRVISENSNVVAESAQKAVNNARQGGEIIVDILDRLHGLAKSAQGSERHMKQLSDRSEEIGRIIGVIDEIAEQTNLLAINAAIEAARAGSQGRGFAIVAGEVRRLAERTTQATREIAQVIGNVQGAAEEAVEEMRVRAKAVERGVVVTGTAGKTIDQMLREMETVSNMIAQIATAAGQQSMTTQQINSRMDQINMLVADSASGSQVSARSCEQLFNLSMGLQNMVARFHLGREDMPSNLLEQTGI